MRRRPIDCTAENRLGIVVDEDAIPTDPNNPKLIEQIRKKEIYKYAMILGLSALATVGVGVAFEVSHPNNPKGVKVEIGLPNGGEQEVVFIGSHNIPIDGRNLYEIAGDIPGAKSVYDLEVVVDQIKVDENNPNMATAPTKIEVN